MNTHWRSYSKEILNRFYEAIASLLLVVSLGASAQIGSGASSTTIKEMSIQEITLADTFLVDYIQSMIKTESSSDTLFAKRGYVMLYIRDSPYDTQFKGEKTLHSYYVNKQFISRDETEKDLLFPPYYTYIAGRIVLVFSPVLEGAVHYKFSDASKRAFLERLEPFLAPKVYTEWPDANGGWKEVKNHRPGDAFYLHGSRVIYIFRDRNKAPLVLDEKY